MLKERNKNLKKKQVRFYGNDYYLYTHRESIPTLLLVPLCWPVMLTEDGWVSLVTSVLAAPEIIH